MENNKPRTKRDFLDEMYLQYDRLKGLCEMKYHKAMEVEDTGSNQLEGNRKKTKQENTDLKEYNQQVSTLARVTSIIIAIDKSDIKDGEEIDDGEEELI